MSARRATPAALAALLLGCLCACTAESRKTYKEADTNVLTLQNGTMCDLEALRGTGPFREYPVPPTEMLDIVTAVLKTKVPAVFPTKGSGSVFAKEREGKEKATEDYSPPWVSAVAVFVTAVGGKPDACRVEIHATNRGTFTRGTLRWETEIPPLLDEAVAHRGSTPIRPL